MKFTVFCDQNLYIQYIIPFFMYIIIVFTFYSSHPRVDSESGLKTRMIPSQKREKKNIKFTSREAPGHDSVQLVQITPIAMVLVLITN